MQRFDFTRIKVLAVALPILLIGACRGGLSEKPPVHLVFDMDDQQKIEGQESFEFAGWTDGRGPRMPVAGTVARGTLEKATHDKFQDESGAFLSNPLPATLANLERGRERYNIYCAVCHDRAGSGKGLVLQRAPQGSFNPVVPDLASEPRLRTMSDGEIYQTIKMGKGTMPAYGHMVSIEDRWNIVWYLRALQKRFD